MSFNMIEVIGKTSKKENIVWGYFGKVISLSLYLVTARTPN